MVSIMSNNWNPFFALANTRGKIDEAFDSREDVEKPYVSEERLYEIQEMIMTSYEECQVIEVKYFKNNRIINEVGIVNKVDPYTQTIMINNKSLKFDNIIEVI